METIEIIIGHNNLEWLDDAIREAVRSHGYEYHSNRCVDITSDGIKVFRVKYEKVK